MKVIVSVLPGAPFPEKEPDRWDVGRYVSLWLVSFKQSTRRDLRIVCIHHATNT